MVVLVISIVTLGIGISVFECFFARDLEAQLDQAKLRPSARRIWPVVAPGLL